MFLTETILILFCLWVQIFIYNVKIFILVTFLYRRFYAFSASINVFLATHIHKAQVSTFWDAGNSEVAITLERGLWSPPRSQPKGFGDLSILNHSYHSWNGIPAQQGEVSPKNRFSLEQIAAMCLYNIQSENLFKKKTCYHTLQKCKEIHCGFFPNQKVRKEIQHCFYFV